MLIYVGTYRRTYVGSELASSATASDGDPVLQGREEERRHAILTTNTITHHGGSFPLV